MAEVYLDGKIVKNKILGSCKSAQAIESWRWIPNGKSSPNIWGKDVFGMNIYKDKLEPFGAAASNDEVEFDCSRQGTGMYCSSYYINNGGAF